MFEKIKEYSGWNDIPELRKYIMKCLAITYLFGFFTALLLAKLTGWS